MLLLVFPDRHRIGLIEQDVGRHQHRIVEDADADTLALAAALLFELDHAPQLAHVGHGVEDPRQLRVLRHVRLHDDDGALGVDAGGQEHVGRLDGAALELGLLLPDRDGVQVDHAVDAVVRLLHGDVVADGAQVVAQMECPGGLGAREDARAARLGGRLRAARGLLGSVGTRAHEGEV